MAEATFDIKVGGEYACFTRPEFKVERVTYPIMTPSAARGLCEAIFWKPEFNWEVREIWVLKPIKQTALLRNEISDVQGITPFFVEDKRQQRSSLILKDVKYLIRAAIVLRPHLTEPVAKYADQFRRRLERGQCHHTPCLGTREFAASFEPAAGDEEPVPVDFDVGTMVFDTAYREDATRDELQFYRHDSQGRHVVHGYTETLFFPAKVAHGILGVPRELYHELHRLEGKDA